MSWLDAPEPSRLDRIVTEVRRAVAWRRRLLAAGLAAGAVAFGLQALAPTPAPGRPALVATHDLASGTLVRGGDVRMSHWVDGRLPTGALGSAGLAVGRVVASAVRTGEILTDVRLVGTSSLTGLPAGLVAVPVRVADAESVSYFQTGDLVDLLAAGIADTASGRVVASAVRVLAVSPRPASGPAGTFGTAGSAGTFRAAGGSGAGALILVAVSPDSALRLAAAAVNDRISVVLRHY